MAALITASDIESAFGRAFTAEETTNCELFIELAMGEIETYLGRPITIQEFTESYVSDHNGSVYFRNTPVVTIEDLEVNGETITTPSTFVTITPFGFDGIWEQSIEYPGVGALEQDRPGYYGADITVTYTAGLDFPQAVRSLVFFGVLQKMRREDADRTKAASSQSGTKRIKDEDYEIEFERVAGSSSSSGSSSIVVFGSPADFISIERLKRRGIG